MKIVDARLYSYKLPYKRAVQWSDTAEDSAEYVLLELTADDGRAGLSEVTVKRTWNGVSARSVIAAVEDLFLPVLKSSSVPTTEESLQEYLRLVPENSAAKCLVGTALDQLIGNAHSDDGEVVDVPLSWAVTRQPPALMAREAAAMVEAHGFRTLKVKGGQGFDVDEASVREIRAAVGDGVTLTVDANGAYGVDAVPGYAAMLAGAGVSVVEDPASLLADARLRGFVEASPVPLLIDFPCATAWHAEALITAGCNAVNVKPGRYGTPEARVMAALCARSNVKTCIGLFGESLLGTLINLQMARRDPALVAWLPAELSFYLMLNEQVVAHDGLVRNGSLSVPSLPSLLKSVDRHRIGPRR